MSEELSSSHFTTATKIDFFSYLAHSINHLHTIVELYARLTIIGKLYCLANIETTAIGSNFAKKHLKEGGFTRTIFTHNAEFFVAREVVIEIIKNFVVAKSLANILRFEYFRTKIC